jgi:hypothetical protein
MTPASFPSGVDVRSRHLARWAALGLMVVLVLAIPASQCRWTVDDPYLLDFARMTLREAHAEWMRLWGFERLQTPLLCHLQYPLGEGLCHLLRVAVHVACAALYGLLLVRLGWGSAVAVTSVFFWLFLPFQVEPVMLPNFQSLLSQPALLGSLLLFERGGAATATATRAACWSLAPVLAFVATLGHGSYLFSPLLLLTLPACPARRRWQVSPTTAWLAAGASAVVPIAVSSLLHVVHRYPLRGAPTGGGFPKIVLSMQYRCLEWTATNLRDAFTHPQVPFLVAQSVVLLLAAIVFARSLPAATVDAADEDAAPGTLARFGAWAYAWVLVGYGVYFLSGGATGTARQNYVASMGIAAVLGAAVTGLRRTRLGRPLATAILALTLLGTLGVAWRYVRWTEGVAACIARREGRPSVPVFVRLYTRCADEAWAVRAPVGTGLSFDEHNVRNWVVTGFSGFMSREDPRPLETQMARKLAEAFAKAWPFLDAAARRRLAEEVEREVEAAQPADRGSVPAEGPEEPSLASITARAELLFERLRVQAEPAGDPAS